MEIVSHDRPIVDLLVPVQGPDASYGPVLAGLPRDLLRHVFVVHTGTTTESLPPATSVPAGLKVLATPRRGFGAAVLRGMEHLQELEPRPAVVVVMASDGSDDPADVPALLRPVLKGGYDLVIGSRMLGPGRGASLSPLNRYGNVVAVQLIRVVYGYSYSDLSTFFAIRFPALVALGMHDYGAGFATELRVKALKVDLRVAEVPAARRRRRAEDQAETLRSKLDAGYKSLYQILRNATIR